MSIYTRNDLVYTRQTIYLVVNLCTGFLGIKNKEFWGTRFCNEGWKMFSSRPQHWKCIVQHGVVLRDKVVGPEAPIIIYTLVLTHLLCKI